MTEKGERKAHACAKAWLQQLPHSPESICSFRGAAVSLLCMQFTGRPLLLTIVGAALLCSCCSRVETRAEPIRNLARIPAPNPQLYADVQAYEHWRNPFLVVVSDGIRVHCLAPAFEKKVPVGALHQTLLSLPLSAWPSGTIVAVQAGGGPQTDANLRLVEENRVQIEAILKAAGVTIDYWP